MIFLDFKESECIEKSIKHKIIETKEINLDDKNIDEYAPIKSLNKMSDFELFAYYQKLKKKIHFNIQNNIEDIDNKNRYNFAFKTVFSRNLL